MLTFSLDPLGLPIYTEKWPSPVVKPATQSPEGISGVFIKDLSTKVGRVRGKASLNTGVNPPIQRSPNIH